MRASPTYWNLTKEYWAEEKLSIDARWLAVVGALVCPAAKRGVNFLEPQWGVIAGNFPVAGGIG